jgi:hypothetical protein
MAQELCASKADEENERRPDEEARRLPDLRKAVDHWPRLPGRLPSAPHVCYTDGALRIEQPTLTVPKDFDARLLPVELRKSKAGRSALRCTRSARRPESPRGGIVAVWF